MNDALAECCRARVNAASLPALAALRAVPELTACVRGEALWLFWPPGEPELTRAILALDGVELFLRRDNHWHRPGDSLPTFDVPDADGARPLAALLTPAPFAPTPPDVAGWLPVPLRLVVCDVPRPCTLMRVALADLLRWADAAPTQDLSAVSATHDGDAVLLHGDRLPPVSGERFWGKRVLFPVGRRPEPDLGEDVLAAALRLEANEVALVGESAEVVPLAAFAPLTRAGVRLAADAKKGTGTFMIARRAQS